MQSIQNTQNAHRAPTVTVYEGVVLWFKPVMGYGFIQFDGDQTVFFHRDAINAPIGYRQFAAGDFVSFEMGRDFKSRPAALKVTRIENITGGAK
jgi:cold shock CspA family protein